MIHKLRFDSIDKINLIPVIGSFSSLTLIFLKTFKCPMTTLSSHTFKELIITTIPVIGTIYLLFFRSYPLQTPPIAEEIKSATTSIAEKPKQLSIKPDSPFKLPEQQAPLSPIQKESALDDSFATARSKGSSINTPTHRLPPSPNGSLPGTEQISRAQSRLPTPISSRYQSPEAGSSLPIGKLSLPIGKLPL